MIPPDCHLSDHGYYLLRDGRWKPGINVSVRFLAGTPDAELLEDIRYVSRSGRIRRATRELLFDGGSIPPPFWPLVGHPWSEYLVAYAVHDEDHEIINVKLHWGTISREQAQREIADSNRDFRDGLKWVNRYLQRKSTWRSRLKIQLKYAGVRIYAWWRYR